MIKLLNCIPYNKIILEKNVIDQYGNTTIYGVYSCGACSSDCYSWHPNSTALPRFVNLHNSAHESALAATSGAFFYQCFVSSYSYGQ